MRTDIWWILSREVRRNTELIRTTQFSSPNDRDGLVTTVTQLAEGALELLPDGERKETYAISFYITDEEDDPRLPTLTIGTNRESQVDFVTHQPPEFVKPNPWWTPSDKREARWNYAFWLQNELGFFPPSSQQRQHLEHLIRSKGLWFEDPEDPNEWNIFGKPVRTFFVTICIEASTRLHSDGVIMRLFDRFVDRRPVATTRDQQRSRFPIE
jgi:hypothetical protein